MKVIYDEVKAISRKEEVERETEKENKWREKENKKIKWKGAIIIALLVALIIGATIFMVSYMSTADDKPLFIGLGVAVIILVVFAASFFVETELWEKKTVQYPVDVEYFLKTDGYNVLRVFTKKSDDGYHGIYVDRESKEHKVDTVCIGFLKDTIRADLPVDSEPIADLAAKEYCIPYQYTKKELN